MTRDYTKYKVKGLGENLNKRQLVFEIVKDYIEKKKPSFDELTSVFKDEIQGSKGFIRKAAKVEDPKRFNTKTPLKIKFGVEVLVSNQWGSKNMDAFLNLAKKLKHKVLLEQSEGVEKDVSSPDTAETNNTNQEVAEIIYDFPTMKIPDNLFQNYKAEWGRYLVYYLENSPELEDYEKFEITLDMQDRVVVGRKEQDDDCRRWFNSWEVMIYELYSDDKSYDGAFTISAGDKYDDNWLDDDAFRWQIACHTGFEDLYDGELPNGISGEVLGLAIAKPEEIFQIYNHIQKNKILQQSEVVEKDDKSILPRERTNDVNSNSENSEALKFEIQVLGEDGAPGPSFEIKVDPNHDDLRDNIAMFETEVNYESLEGLVDKVLTECEDEIYNQLITNSIEPEADDRWNKITLEDLCSVDNDWWWDHCPHFVVTKIGEIDLSPLYFSDYDDNDVAKGSDLLKVSKDDFEDYTDDFKSQTRHSLDVETFKEKI